MKNAHLGVSVGVVSFVALSYGISPNTILPLFFDFKVETIDLHNIFRATMGLYLGHVLICLMGILKNQYWKLATVSNIIFMGSLAFGRLLSLLIDGVPSLMFCLGLVGEVGFAVWGVMNLRKYDKI